MVRHQNSSINEAALRILNSKMGEFLPDEVGGPVAVIVIEPVVRIARRALSGTIYATPTDKDFYLTGAAITFAKDATNTGTNNGISVTIENVVVQIVEIAGITLTADAQTESRDFSVPLKIDRGTNIIFTTTGTYTSQRAHILGYTQEVTRT